LFVSCRVTRRIECPRSIEKPVTRCATTKVMIFSCQEAQRLVAFQSAFSASTAPGCAPSIGAW
jgi:hypothetical protein